jgi:hypothetical protein
MSFADGFRSGFGLISDVQDRQVAERRLDEQARQGDLDREATALYRKNQTDNQAEVNRIRGIDSEARLLTAKNNETQLNLDKIRAESQAGLYGAQADALNQKTGALNKTQSNIEKEQTFAINAQKYIDHIKTGSSASARTPEWNARSDELFQLANGGLMSPFAAVDPDTKSNGVAFGKVLTAIQGGEDAGRENVTPIINTLIRSSNERQIGTELTAQNTPNAGHLNGKGWKIIGKEVSPDWQIVDGMLTGTVDVTVENAAGDVTVYNAPLSSGRSGQKVDDGGNPVNNPDGSPATPAPLGIATDDLMKAASGYFKYAQYMGQFEDEIYQSATRLYDERNGAGSLADKANAYITKFQTDYAVGTLAGEQSPIKGLTNAELASPQHFNKLERYAQHSVLDPSKNAIKPTGAAESLLSKVAMIPDVKDLEKDVNDQLGRGLTRSELLRAQQYFTFDEKTKKLVINREDKKPFELWKNELLGIVETRRSPNPRRGGGGYGYPSDEMVD